MAEDLENKLDLDYVLGLKQKPDLPMNTSNQQNTTATTPTTDTKALKAKLQELLKLLNQEEQSQSRSQPQPQPTNQNLNQNEVLPDPTNPNVVVNLTQNMASGNKLQVVCESCGSTAVRMLTDTQGVCQHCGASIIIDRPQTPPPVNIEIVNNTNDDVQGSSQTRFVLRTNYDVQEFKRASIINLAANKQTPVDILDSEFGEVQVKYFQFIAYQVCVEGTYSASIGYDRKEQYWDIERVYDSDLKMYVNKKVLKERTVTDWQPYNGTISESQFTCVGTKGPFDNYEDKYFKNLLKANKNRDDIIPYRNSGLDIEFIAATPEDKRQAFEDVNWKIEYDLEKNLPGEHKKDFKFNCSNTIEKAEYFVAPVYVMPYTYNKVTSCKGQEFVPIGRGKFNASSAYDGVEYEASSYTTWFRPMGNFPSASGEIENITAKKANKYAPISLIASILSMVLAVVCPFVIMNGWGITLGIASMILTILGYIIYRKLYEKEKNAIHQDWLDEKLQRLEKYLAQHHFAPLTAEERRQFELKYLEMKELAKQAEGL